MALDLAGLTQARTILDGEVCVLDDLGRSDFDRLQARGRLRRWRAGADPVVFVVFDLLMLRGRDLRPQPLRARKAALSRLLASPPAHVMLSKHVPGRLAPALFRAAQQLQLEGIVLKRSDSRYESGDARSGAWVKVKREGATPAGQWARRRKEKAPA